MAVSWWRHAPRGRYRAVVNPTDPWGRILADGGEGEGVVLAEIDLDQVDATRSRIPSLTHGREYSFVSGDPEKAAG